MMKRAVVCGAVAVMMGSVLGMRSEGVVEVSISPDVVVNRVDEKVYGHFLEHIFHSVNGGLWGEMIWDRSFEGGTASGSRWSVENDCLVQDGMAENVRLVFGNPTWTDYEFTLEARKTGGQEGFLVLFRVADEKRFYWANLGGWSNVRHSLERGIKGQSRWGAVGPSVPGKIELGKWYRIRIRCEGRHIQVWLDDDKLIDFTDDARANLSGRVGVGTWNTEARYRNLRVISLEGKKLFHGLPEVKQQPAPLHSWETYGRGKTSLTADEPLNCDNCQLIVSESGETGVQQTPLCIRRGETYYGSIWARGDAPDGDGSPRVIEGSRRGQEGFHLARSEDAAAQILDHRRREDEGLEDHRAQRPALDQTDELGDLLVGDGRRDDAQELPALRERELLVRPFLAEVPEDPLFQVPLPEDPLRRDRVLQRDRPLLGLEALQERGVEVGAPVDPRRTPLIHGQDATQVVELQDRPFLRVRETASDDQADDPRRATHPRERTAR